MLRRPILFAAVLLCATAASAELKERVAAVVNGQPIALSEVLERVGPEVARVPQGPAGAAQRDELIHRGLEALIDEKLIDAEATSLGFDLTEEELDRTVLELARQNNMDVPQFKEALQAQGIAFDTVKESLRRQQLMMKLMQFKVKPRKVSDEEVQAAYATLAEQGDIEVRARHIFIASPDGGTPAQSGLAKEKADTALTRLNAGESFAKVARDFSEGPSAREGGDLGWLKRGTLQVELAAPLFALAAGKHSGLIRTVGEHGGWHILYAEERRKSPPRPLAEMQEELRTRLSNDSILKERDHYMQSLRKAAQIDQKL